MVNYSETDSYLLDNHWLMKFHDRYSPKEREAFSLEVWEEEIAKKEDTEEEGIGRLLGVCAGTFVCGWEEDTIVFLVFYLDSH